MTSRRPYRARPYPAIITVTKPPKAEKPGSVRHNEAGSARHDCEMPDQGLPASQLDTQPSDHWQGVPTSTQPGTVEVDLEAEWTDSEEGEDGYSGGDEIADEAEGAGRDRDEASSNGTIRGSPAHEHEHKHEPEPEPEPEPEYRHQGDRRRKDSSPALQGLMNRDRNDHATCGDLIDALEDLRISSIQREEAALPQDPKPNKSLLTRKHKNAKELAINSDIRNHISKLMDRSSKTDPFPTLPSATELRRFSRHALGGPTLDDFRVLVTGFNSACPWNQEAASIAAKNYISRPDALTTDEDYIRMKILTHFRSLGEQYKNIQKRGLESDDERYIQSEDKCEANRRKNRRRELGIRRVDTTELFKGLTHFTKVICSLQTGGTSEDEKDPRDLIRIPPRYVIRKLEWRSAELTRFLRTLDLLHLSTRFTSKGRPTQGNWPRHRVEGRVVDDTSPVIKGLPLNFYDPDWFLDLDPEQRAQLRHKPAVKLEMSNQLLDLAARFRHVKTMADTPLPPPTNDTRATSE